ncbi:hypothetical protein CDV36_014003 [Fusarium kuroshium]|uniref:Uncharacterized protein n=2 Tax=Fusarium solani species complex TaxID=232080 RepID=A0A3M2RJ01_9HYPO|nr:hypothetical protein CDV36_014003 [Fusarium kuroshium]RSL62388.1 hypothetical protein CEP51_013480 [Fusarium floridanum]
MRDKRGKKRTSSNTLGWEAPSKRKRPPPNKVASLLWKQISGTSNKSHRERNFLPGDSEIAEKLNYFQQLVEARPDRTDWLVGELQEWLRQIQQDSSLHLASLQHHLTCIDLYNWANQNDDSLERSKDKIRWHEVQVARYRNRLANEICKIKGGNSDRLGLAVLPLITVKRLKFANLQRGTEEEEVEIIQKLATIARPALEKGLKELGRSKFWAPNPVSFVAWFLGKSVGELDDIRKVLCLSDLSIQDCHPSPKIQHQIQTSDSMDMCEDGGIRPDWRANAFSGLLLAPEVGEEHDDENARGHIHEEPTINETQFDPPIDLSLFLDSEGLGLGF